MDDISDEDEVREDLMSQTPRGKRVAGILGNGSRMAGERWLQMSSVVICRIDA